MKPELRLAILIGNIWYAGYFIMANIPTWFMLLIGLFWTVLAFGIWRESRRKS